MPSTRPELEAFADEVADDGLDAVVLLGMGGSSLAPEVLRRTFGVEASTSSTRPTRHAIRALEASIDLGRTLFISASKSGGTLETRSHTDYFWERTGEQRLAVRRDHRSRAPSSRRCADERGFRRVFAGEPTIGGRYSALSPFGMVPAALMGIDLARFLANADRMTEVCRQENGNPGYELGRSFGAGWEEGRDKICIGDTDGGFGLWAEQLIAESTGKQGKGLVPAPGESPDGPDRQAAEPQIADPYSLAGEFFRWEFAVAVAGHFSASTRSTSPTCRRQRTRRARCSRRARSLTSSPRARSSGCSRRRRRATTSASRRSFSRRRRTTAASRISSASSDARAASSSRTAMGRAISTRPGSCTRVGRNTGLFLQVVDDPGDELAIPDQPFGFRRLIRAQAAGDYASLKERGRRVARLHLEDI